MSLHKSNRDQKRVTITQIAKAANVAISTASVVLNNRTDTVPISAETRERVRAIARELGYRPSAAARALVTGRSNSVLIVTFDMMDPHLLPRLSGVEDFLVSLDYTVQFCTVDEYTGLKGFSSIVRSGKADGVLLTGMASPPSYPLLQSLCREAEELDIPIVAIANAFPPDLIKLAANIDDASGAEQAVTHLIQHGRRRIVMMGMAHQPWSDERIRGYKVACKKAAVPVDPDLIMLGDLDLMWYYDTTKRLVASSKFDAMFLASDGMAVAAIAAIRDSGKNVPSDYAVVGYNNDQGIGRFNDPPLTTVQNPFREAGYAAAELLVNSIEGKPCRPIMLPVSLVIRRSCGCPGATADSLRESVPLR